MEAPFLLRCIQFFVYDAHLYFRNITQSRFLRYSLRGIPMSIQEDTIERGGISLTFHNHTLDDPYLRNVTFKSLQKHTVQLPPYSKMLILSGVTPKHNLPILGATAVHLTEKVHAIFFSYEDARPLYFWLEGFDVEENAGQGTHLRLVSDRYWLFDLQRVGNSQLSCLSRSLGGIRTALKSKP